MIVRAVLLLSMLVLLAAPVRSQDASEQAAIRDVIEKQIDAFRRDDGEAAFGFASPTIRGMFGSADVFMEMVRRGYQPVYRPRSIRFGKLGEVAGQIAQEVHVIAPDGRPVTAVYVMTQMPDGSWRVDGCYLLAPTPHQA